MARGDGEDWLKGGAVRPTGGPPEAADDEVDWRGVAGVVAVALLIAALTVELPLQRATLVGLGVTLIGACARDLLGQVTGRPLPVSAARSSVGLLVGAAALAAGLTLDERGAWLVLTIGGAVLVADELRLWLARRWRRSGDAATPSAPQ